MCVCERETETETDRQTDRKTDRQTEGCGVIFITLVLRERDRQTDREMWCDIYNPRTERERERDLSTI